MNLQRISSWLTAASLLFVFSAARGQMTDNYELRAVPVPAGKAVKVDGKLDEWDRSGEIFSCYDRSELADRFSVRTTAMYDKENLYVAYHFKDATPMFNTVDPVALAGSGWRGDCVEMRFWIDPEKPYGPGGGRIAHLDGYYYTPEKKPVARLVYQDCALRGKPEGVIEDALKEGMEEAFTADPDGKGYVQELKIPFKLLRRDGRPYLAGESLRLGLEWMWGDATGSRWPQHRFADMVNAEHPQRQFFWASKAAWGELKFLAQGNLPPSPTASVESKAEELQKQRYGTQGVVPFSYELPADGFATLVIETPDGQRVRNWISDVPRKAGKNVDLWDGRNDEGQVVESGDYRVRGLYHAALDLKYQFTYGNPGNPPWETSGGDGGWLSDHAAPMACAANADGVFLAAWTSESSNTVIRVDLKGQKQWGIGRINGGPVALHGNYLYMVAGGIHGTWDDKGTIRVTRIDAATGKIVPFQGNKPELVVAKYPIDRSTVKPREWAGALVEKKAYDAEWCLSEAMGLASNGKQLFLSLFYEDKIVAFDPETGTITEEIPIARPAGLAMTASGDLLAVSGKSVVRIGQDRKPVPLIAKDLDAPVGITVDRAGAVYVSDWGASMKVKVFSPKGKLVRQIGMSGGRPLRGAHNPKGMFLPRGLAVDTEGKLWVAEDDMTPKRVSVWDQKGAFFTEFCGPGWYGGTECNVDPSHLNQAFWNGAIVDLDWKTGNWRFASTLWRSIKENELIGPRSEGNSNTVYEWKGRKFLFSTGGGRAGIISELRKDGALPMVAFGSIIRVFSSDHTRLPDVVIQKLFASPQDEALARKEFPSLFVGFTQDANGGHLHRDFIKMLARFQQMKRPLPSQFFWTDANGDGAVQPDELRLFNPSEFNGFEAATAWGSALAPDLTIYVGSTVLGQNQVWKLPVKEWNSHGVPIYDLTQTKRIFDQKSQAEIGHVWSDAAGNVVLNTNPLTMISPEGKALWSYPNSWPGVHGSHTAPKDRNGLLIGPLKTLGSTRTVGEAGEIFAMNGNMGKAFLVTTDGLFVSSLLRDARSAPDSMPEHPVRGMSINHTTGGGEWFGGEFFGDPATGKTYLGSCTLTAENISEVTGLDSIRRLPAVPLAFSVEARDKALELAARDSAAQAAAEVKTMVVAPLTKPLEGSLDAVPWSQDAKGNARWNHDERRSAQATWTFDERYLYLSFRVKDETPMVNGGASWAQLFKTGDAAVFELRTQPNNDKPEVIPGDVRLLFSVFNGQPVAVFYDYLRPGTPLEFSLGVTKTQIADARILDKARLDLRREAGGYTLKAAVLLSDLGFKPAAGAHYRGDFGVIYSDAAGKVNELRMYWSNQATGLNSDLTMEARIEPKRWGTYEINK